MRMFRINPVQTLFKCIKTNSLDRTPPWVLFVIRMPLRLPFPDLIPCVLQLVSAFICVYIIRVIHRQISARFHLRRVPGPKSSSIIWGEEWRLYHNRPGSLHVEWRREFGKVVKFTGAFGVNITYFKILFLISDIFTAPDAFYYRSPGYRVYSG
jgi:hypothetical protein